MHDLILLMLYVVRASGMSHDGWLSLAWNADFIKASNMADSLKPKIGKFEAAPNFWAHL